MDTITKTIKVHYPRRAGKDILNREDYEVRVVGEETEDNAEYILEEREEEKSE
jgi:hypothetical protein